MPGKLAGAKEGETREIEVTFPADYPREVPGQGRQAARHDQGDRAAARSRAERGDRRRNSTSIRWTSSQDVREYIRRARKQAGARTWSIRRRRRCLDEANFGLPEGLLKRQAQRNLDRQQMRLRMRGVPEEEITKRMDELRAVSEEAAARDFKLFFMLRRSPRPEKIFVTENEVEGRHRATGQPLPEEHAQDGAGA